MSFWYQNGQCKKGLSYFMSQLEGLLLKLLELLKNKSNEHELFLMNMSNFWVIRSFIFHKLKKINLYFKIILFNLSHYEA